ncbi:hypothetical protein PMZ80_000314 [Knufia obscura]|uniref:DDHD domain-containing protein n=2 Tax=Knufia TaxID=430999 RepID=A0AAN8FE85_9EURO|nr:hypothetical protein PMZ80_000314 [Knufia obscura]KAK5956756.1 hypothetical protein OHC33_002244 [Knufia fluminis]
MAEANKTSNTSFLGAINPWSRTTTPEPPKSPKQQPHSNQGVPLKHTPGDHSLSARPVPSLRRYPKDCPPLKSRWYYAVDLAKRKPFAALEPSSEEKRALPKKWVLFSEKDSKAIENAFQQLGREDEFGERTTSTKIPVNEDYLYDVHIERRELEPAYWIGPVYDVRRGSWFYQDSSPCEENLANQLEEGYLKTAPWRKKTGAPRSVSQPGARALTTSESASQGPAVAAPTETTNPNTYRLFGAHMNTTATYFDASTAYLSADDFMSRMSSTVYGRFGGPVGTKVVRGYSVPAQPTSASKTVETKEKRKSTKLSDTESSTEEDGQPPAEQKDTVSRPSALERQLSSLAGLGQSQSQDQQKQQEEEEARVEDEKEMEDARDQAGEDQDRQIDHLILVTHGIGQRLGLRLDSINFVHDVNTMRKTMKAVFEASPDLQALTDNPRNCTVQVLPICWRHLLDFPKQSLKQNRKEHDLADLDESVEEEYPSLQDITVDGVPAVRNLITDLALDVLLYQSAYREHVAKIMQKEVNRVHKLFKERTGFNGEVTLCGHSLGSAIFFDILCRQGQEAKTRPSRASSKTSRIAVPADQDVALDFNCENFFALGSPIALFQMLKGRTIAGRPALHDQAPPTSPYDPDPMQNNPFQSVDDISSQQQKSLIPITTSSPKCAEFYNIFHPTDPIAYRCEPLISPAMSSLKPQALPYTKRGLFAAPGMANLTARMGQQVMNSWYSLTSGVASTLINRSLGITGEEQALPLENKTRPVSQQFGESISDPNRATTMPPPPVTDVMKTSSKQKNIAEQAKSNNETHPNVKRTSTSGSEGIPTLIDTEMETLYAGFQKRRQSQASTGDGENSLEYELEQDKAKRLRREEGKVRALNSNGRVDYHIQEGMFDVSLLASIASHLSYWADADVNHFMVSQLLKSRDKDKRREEEKDKIVL